MLFATAPVFHHGPLEEAAFAVLLYLAVFCFLALLIAPPADSSLHQSVSTNETYPRAEHMTPKESPTPATSATPQTAITQEQPIVLPEDSGAIDDFVQGLSLRHARKVAKALNIRQKVNGKDKRLEQFKREIRQALRKNATPLPHVPRSTA